MLYLGLSTIQRLSLQLVLTRMFNASAELIFPQKSAASQRLAERA